MNNKLLFFTALSVLNCPMSVKDKIKTLERQLLVNLTKEDLEEFSQVLTGLEAFDKACKSYLTKLYKEVN